MRAEQKAPLRFADIDRTKLTPMMQQLMEIKDERPDCLIFFRLGDFYELFFDDALTVAKVLNLTLTKRDCGLEERAPMAGVPHHAANNYLIRLVKQGYKVAIVDQVEDPKQAKGLVKRAVVQVVTPGTLLQEDQLNDKQLRYIVAVFQLDEYYGLAACELSSTRFVATQFIYQSSSAKLLDEMARYQPVEVIGNARFAEGSLAEAFHQKTGIKVSSLEEASFSADAVVRYDCLPPEEKDSLWARATAGLLAYIQDHCFHLPEQLPQITPYAARAFMRLNQSSREHLELTQSMRDRKRRGSLLWALDHCQTSMGSRLLREWIEHPLLSVDEIVSRQDAIQALIDAFMGRQSLREQLGSIYDLERLAGKLSLQTITPRDVLALGEILSRLPAIKEEMESLASERLRSLYEALEPMDELAEELLAAIVPEPPIQVKEGGIFQDAYDERLEGLRRMAKDGKTWLLDLEQRERERTGIKSLKIRYNRVFGYAIEVTHANKASVPEHYVRKQTLRNSERYITTELKEMESQILHAEQNSLALEYELFVALKERLLQHLQALRQNARVLAELDLYGGLAELAERQQYARPVFEDAPILSIEEGRHPVVERMQKGSAFVPNDLDLEAEGKRLMVLTGPNMSGKSTYMRQVALIVLMAQMGSFVPAKAARLGLCDAIYTRVGASDDLAQGQSTFMVEMSEMAEILREASPQSLLILDEIGRGTSTWDGLSIAWSVIEYLAGKEGLGARSLFATHYHELTDLAAQFPRVFNAHFDLVEEGQDIVFLHQLLPGGSDDSYGIEVARLAGVPEKVVARAREILWMLEQENQGKRLQTGKAQPVMEGQLDLFSAAQHYQERQKLLDELARLDLNLLRPLDALAVLADIQAKLQAEGKDPL